LLAKVILVKWDHTQKSALDCRGSCVIIGAAGTGKTAIIIEKVARLLKSGCHPEGVLAATHSRLAARDLSGVIHKVRPVTKSRLVKVETIRDLAARQLREAGTYIGVADANKVDVAITRVCQEIEGLPRNMALAIIREEKAKLEEPGHVDRTPEAELTEMYDRHLRSRNLFDPMDVVREAVARMTENIIRPLAVTELLVDQFESLTPIESAWVAAHAEQGVVVTVACDDDQGVERGAAGSSAVTAFASQAGAELVCLEVTYRIPARLLVAIQKLVSDIPGRLDKSTCPHEEVMTEIICAPMESPEIEAGLIAQTAASLPMAVLVHDPDYLDEIELACAGMSVDYVRVSGPSVLAHPSVALLVDLLKSVVASDFARIQGVLKRLHVDQKGWKYFAAQTDNPGDLREALYAGIEEVEGVDEGILALSRSLITWREIIHEHPAQVFNEVRDWVADRQAPLWHRRILALCDGFDPEEDSFESIASWIEGMLLYTTTMQGPPKADSKKTLLMTIGDAKGRAFRHVWLPGLGEGMGNVDMGCPSRERRLIYTGMTRATGTLTITTPAMPGTSELHSHLADVIGDL